MTSSTEGSSAAMSTKDVAAVLVEALDAVRAADLPAALEPIAYGKAIEMLSLSDAKHSPAVGTAFTPAETPPHESGSALQRIAKRLGLADPQRLAYVFEVEDDEVTLVVQRSRLSKDKANASREVALLYTAARQGAGLDPGTTAYLAIRERVVDMGVYDSKNFATTLGAMRDLFAIRGSGKSREFKVTQHGFEEAAKLVMKIAGGND